MAFVRILILVSITSLGICQGQTREPHAIKSVYFGGGSYYIDILQSEEVKEFIAEHYIMGKFEVTIHSHTDNIGGAAYNDWLSEMRSESTIDILEQSAVDRESIAIKDFGQHNPIYDNDTLEGRLKNRRVDIILWPINL